MPEIRSNRTREKRIADEIVVDCYTAGECAMGWYCYLEGKLSFPFPARCIAVRSVSPLKKGEIAEVVAMAHEDDSLAEMFVLVSFAGRRVGVPLAQLGVVKTDRGTCEVPWPGGSCDFGNPSETRVRMDLSCTSAMSRCRSETVLWRCLSPICDAHCCAGVT